MKYCRPNHHVCTPERMCPVSALHVLRDIVAQGEAGHEFTADERATLFSNDLPPDVILAQLGVFPTHVAW